MAPDLLFLNQCWHVTTSAVNSTHLGGLPVATGEGQLKGRAPSLLPPPWAPALRIGLSNKLPGGADPLVPRTHFENLFFILTATIPAQGTEMPSVLKPSESKTL